MRIAGTVARVLFGGLFVYASLDKILHPHAFLEIIDNYRLLPHGAAAYVAVFLPWIEAVCGICLCLNILPSGAAVILNALMAAFLVALGLNLARGIDVHCGCFTTDPLGETDMGLTLARDVAIFLLGLLVLRRVWLQKGQQKA